ncbi:uncharacterized protein LOC143784714 [Ranitomeya variabilis]|uniref:uncharacterized protein LOC143784714 n=1 Tax=Ranitomeya variabilis TaxID=490064 RepID=UPI0040570027
MCGQFVPSHLSVKTDSSDQREISVTPPPSGPVYVTPEDQLRRPPYCMMLLPSPLFQKERLMVTSPIAQRYAITNEERAREKRKREERGKKLKLGNYLDEEEDEEEEEKVAKKIKLGITENELRRKTLKELCTWLDEEEEEEEEDEEEKKKKRRRKQRR